MATKNSETLRASEIFYQPKQPSRTKIVVDNSAFHEAFDRVDMLTVILKLLREQTQTQNEYGNCAIAYCHQLAEEIGDWLLESTEETQTKARGSQQPT